MVESKLTHFFPSVLTGAVLFLFAFLADWQHGQVLSQDKWERVGHEADMARSQLLRALSDDTVRDLANSLGMIEDLTQSVFDLYVHVALEGNTTAVQVELVPGFRAVLSPPAVEVGQPTTFDQIRNSPDGRRALLTQYPPAATLSGPLKSADGRLLVASRTPFLKYSDGTASLLGTLFLYLDLKEVLRHSGIPDPARAIDYAVTFEPTPAGARDVVYGSEEIISGRVFSTDIPLPAGKWTIYAQPVGGWDATFAERLPYRLILLVLGALIMVPTIAANWYATERRKTIDEQNAAKVHLSSLLRNMPVAVCIYTMPAGRGEPGPNDTIRFINADACARIWGIDAAEVETDVMRLWATGPHGEYQENLLRIIRESAADLAPWHYSWPIRLSDGTEKWLDGRGHPMRLPDGSTRWFNLIVDATAEMAISAELERRKEMAVLAQKSDSLGKLTGGVAHDFNNLLAVIMGNQELLRDELEKEFEERPELREFVDNSLLATARGADLTRKMLAFARRARLEPAVLDLNDIVRETSAWAGRTMPESVRLEFDLGANLPLARVDRGSTENALLNLMVNARDAMPDGGTLSISTSVVTLHAASRICREENLEPGRYLRLIVEDTGEGIAPENLPRVFEPFFTTKPPTSGSGLGLSMVHGFMKQSGGCVRVVSEPGRGTTFQLFFPALPEASRAAPEVPEAAAAEDRRRMRVLLAEDEAEVRQVLRSTLSKEGYDVIEAASGDEALALFRASPQVDLLLTDIIMPGSLSGTDLAQEIRRMNPALPVILLSGYASEGAQADVAKGGGDLRLAKPVSRRKLLAAVADVIARSRAGSASAGMGGTDAGAAHS